MDFENMTIGQLRKFTEDYERLEIENIKLKTKYPTKATELPSEDISAEELVEGLK